MLQKYRTAKKKLQNAIITSKKLHWVKICEEVDRDVWGQGYQIVMKKLRSSEPISTETKIEIAKELFPTGLETKWNINVVVEDKELFNKEEIIKAGDRIKVRKAPGPDLIPPEIIKIVIRQFTQYIGVVMNQVLRSGNIPTTWKTAKLVLFKKPGKTENVLSAHRLICLLNTLGKLLECLVANRIEDD